MLTRRFRPSAYYGDAGGAGARSSDPTTDWTVLHGNELWLDNSCNVFLVFPTTGPTDPRLQVLYRPDGSVPSKIYFANDPALPGIVDNLRTQGRKATPADIERYKAMATARMSGGGGSAPAATFTTAPAPEAPAAPAQPGAAPKKKRRKVKAAGGPLAIVRKTWFPYAVGGVALLGLLVVTMLIKSRRTQGAA
jgi:hypothetical protein